MLDSTNDPQVLDVLAATYGIELDYIDAYGECCETSARAKIELLATMGMSAGSPQAIEQELAHREADGWTRGLPSSLVRRAARTPYQVELTLQAGVRVVDWTMRLEDGRMIQGCADFGALPPLGV